MVSKGVGFGLTLLVISIGFTPAFALTELERVTITDQRLTTGFGDTVGNNINVNQQVQISAEITNNQKTSQEFVYLVQVKDKTGFVISISWITGQLNENQKFNTSLNWTPVNEGEYSAEIYVWNSLMQKIDNSEFSALSDYVVIDINVS
ncbi:MAG: hypothetical protein HKM23_09700 [Nitrosopumilus sp.]|nr:hypothetical protein [Nitrosopumilus sp.]NNL58039.1 hypothetical protein [Nitrosopumilus sp.]